MKRPNNKFTRLGKDLRQLGINETLSHYVTLELRQFAYTSAKTLGIVLCIQRVPEKPGRFEVTRIK